MANAKETPAETTVVEVEPVDLPVPTNETLLSKARKIPVKKVVITALAAVGTIAIVSAVKDKLSSDEDGSDDFTENESSFGPVTETSDI